jgi:hypothetical protein
MARKRIVGRAAKTSAERSEAAIRRMAAKTPAERSAAMRRGWETRRRNQAV